MGDLLWIEVDPPIPFDEFEARPGMLVRTRRGDRITESLVGHVTSDGLDSAGGYPCSVLTHDDLVVGYAVAIELPLQPRSTVLPKTGKGVFRASDVSGYEVGERITVKQPDDPFHQTEFDAVVLFIYEPEGLVYYEVVA